MDTQAFTNAMKFWAELLESQDGLAYAFNLLHAAPKNVVGPWVKVGSCWERRHVDGSHVVTITMHPGTPLRQAMRNADRSLEASYLLSGGVPDNVEDYEATRETVEALRSRLDALEKENVSQAKLIEALGTASRDNSDLFHRLLRRLEKERRIPLACSIGAPQKHCLIMLPRPGDSPLYQSSEYGSTPHKRQADRYPDRLSAAREMLGMVSEWSDRGIVVEYVE